MPKRSREGKKHRIAMVCDFFYPRLGGVEMHIWSLSQCLLRAGHKVIVITHAYGDRKGVRYMTNGLKCYYVPWVPFVDENTLPTLFTFFPLFRDIIIREGIEIVHGHGATSSLMHECMLHARTMGYKTCFTDHSLFGFDDLASIHLNKVLKFTLTGADHCIAVSECDRENLILRASLDETHVTAIPNAVDGSKFFPETALRDPPLPSVNVVVVSRLAFRKGIDLLAHMIPLACQRFPQVHFIIGGDGPKRLLLDEMRERYQLHDRVELLGAVPHAQVRSVLCRGSIFLNCSLTESFCIAILEAACAGLLVVSTKVGGVPEVLPGDMIKFAERPDPNSLVDALEEALARAPHVDSQDFHQRLSKRYSWENVFRRTLEVYEKVSSCDTPSTQDRILDYYRLGPIAGFLALSIVVMDHIIWHFLRWWRPKEAIERAPDLCKLVSTQEMATKQ